jgi:hypothetical protein
MRATARSSRKLDIYLEVGAKRTFAGAIDWPGWCRRGPDEDAAVAALEEAATRYGRAMRGTRLGFKPPAASSLEVVERLKGDATTDFGAPGAAPSADKAPVTAADLRRFDTILRATWRTFDRAVESASGKSLRKGPRGGGRDLEGIIAHLIEADRGYLRALGWKQKWEHQADREKALSETRKAIPDGLTSSAAGEIPRKGPRGGTRWSPRYFVRRVAWHALDHAWEIEDRAT